MIKRVTLALLLCCLIFSCGKKGDPKYKDSDKKVKNQSILISMA